MINRNIIINDIKKIILDVSGENNINENDNFFEKGIDSLTFIKCIIHIEDYFELEFLDSELSFDELSTISKIADKIILKYAEMNNSGGVEPPVRRK